MLSAQRLPSSAVRLCEVTGSEILPGEGMTHRGKYVSAFGKQILMEREQRSEKLWSPDLDGEPAGAFRRPAAAAVDAAIAACCAAIAVLTMAFLGFVTAWSHLDDFATVIAMVGAVLAYYTVAHLLEGGQTPGMKLLRIRVIAVGQRPLSVDRSLLRAASLFAPPALYLLLGAAAPAIVRGLGLDATGVRMLAVGLLGLLGVGAAFYFVNAVWSLFHSEGATLHDLTSGTRVVRNRPL